MKTAPEYLELRGIFAKFADAAHGGRAEAEVARMAELLDALEERRSAAAAEAESLRLRVDEGRLAAERERTDGYALGYDRGVSAGTRMTICALLRGRQDPETKGQVMWLYLIGHIDESLRALRGKEAPCGIRSTPGSSPRSSGGR